MSNQPRVIDPLFHFETHFPERISKLHLNPEYPAAHRRTKKCRARTGTRYKTQPITFDEIKEVDEENIEPESQKENLRGQFQAFSRSMDGLVPKVPQQQGDSTTTPTNSSTPPLPPHTKSCLKKRPQVISPLAREPGPKPRRERSASTTEASTQTFFTDLDKGSSSVMFVTDTTNMDNHSDTNVEGHMT